MKRAALILATCAITAPALAQQAADPHAGHDMSQMDHSQMDHSQMDMSQMDHSQHMQHMAPATGNAAPPPVDPTYMGDQFNDPARMAAARAALLKGMGEKLSLVKVEQLEWRNHKGRDGYAWDAKAWYGGDIDKILLRSEGDGARGESLEKGEIQGLWSHAVNHLYNVELGVRQDFAAGPKPTYAVIGLQGDAPYWVELESALYVSHKGDIHARVKAAHDMRITQELLLQPAVEVNAALQDVPERHIGRGLEDIELGLRLRYEIVREFAPYIGLHYERKLGRTADFARADGESVGQTSLTIGVSFWF